MCVVQLTLSGRCSIAFGEGMCDLAAPGSVGSTHLVVADIETVRGEPGGRGVFLGPVADLGGVRYAYSSDLDGNTWARQQIDPRVPPPHPAYRLTPACRDDHLHG